jgi:hypothetical protein
MGEVPDILWVSWDDMGRDRCCNISMYHPTRIQVGVGGSFGIHDYFLGGYLSYSAGHSVPGLLCNL